MVKPGVQTIHQHYKIVITEAKWRENTQTLRIVDEDGELVLDRGVASEVDELVAYLETS